MNDLLKEIRACQICEAHLPLGVNPVLAASKKSKIAIVGQAPGLAVHQSSVPWDDKSGERLRKWLGVSSEAFYDTDLFAIVPMGFCYPGKGKSGDLPPRKECAATWHGRLFNELTNIQCTLLIGQYAQTHFLGNKRKKTLTETVQSFEEYLPSYFVLPHPSPRNNIWMAKNEWFEKDVLPRLGEQMRDLI